MLFYSDADIPGPGANPLTLLTDRVMDSIYSSPSTAGKVALLINALPSKGCNIMSIPAFIYKRLVENLSPIISLYFNESISLGIFPNCSKIARVIPVYKAGNKNLVGNYRPISTISVLSKLFERLLMFHHLSVFLTKHSIIKPNQFGFRLGHNTTEIQQDTTYLLIKTFLL